MCFSVEVDKDIKKLAARFHASIDRHAFEQFSSMQKIETALDAACIKETLGLKRKPTSHFFKEAGNNSRIYPGYFAPVIVWGNGMRQIRPMRYRVRPHGSAVEIPARFNVFNARIDSLETRRTWKGLFMRKHALFPFFHFFEWVRNAKGKKELVVFAPDGRDRMWAPALYDSWVSKDNKMSFHSFAVITDDPPQEIEEQGHDRCPIFLQETLIDDWLQPQGKSEAYYYKLLQRKEPVHFRHMLPS